VNIEDVVQFLDNMSIRVGKDQFCQNCGSLLDYFGATFFLSASDRAWNIQLRVCSMCTVRAEEKSD